MLNVHRQQANIMRNNIRDSINEHLENLAFEAETKQNRQDQKHLVYVRDHTTISHCLFLVWLQKEKTNIENWNSTTEELSSQRVFEIITLYDLCKEDLGVDYDDFFPTPTGLDYANFTNYFASDFYQEQQEWRLNHETD